MVFVSEYWRCWWPRLRVYLSCFKGLAADDVEEIASDALLRALDKARSYDPTRPFEPWVYTLARRLVLDHQKQLRRKKEQAVDPVELDRYGDGNDSLEPETIVLREEEQLDMGRCVAALPDHERELVFLVYSADLTLAEASRVTGEPLGTVKWRMHSLKARLRAMVEANDAAGR